MVYNGCNGERQVHMNEEKRIALLIDAENISAQYAGYILEEVGNYGDCSYKRIYGSWDRIVKTKWEEEIRKNSLKAMMQINNTKNKNASDSALIIDAMDILYSGNVDGFCIVSSDSDFTGLARRLNEAGLLVVGMGESDKATEALENAYDKFVYIDVLAKQAEEERKQETKKQQAKSTVAKQKQDAAQQKNNPGNIPSKKAVENKIREIIMENDDNGRRTALGLIGRRLNTAFKNFDVRYYGKKYLKDFVKDLKSLQLEEAGENQVYVSLKK